MSFHDSWIAVQGVTGEELLERLGLEETGEVGMAIKVAQPYAWGTTPGGWTIVYANFNGLAHVGNVRDLSRAGLVLACDFQDQVDGDTAMIIAVRDGEKLWEVGAVDDEIFVIGTPPAELEAIQDHYAAELARDPDHVWMCEVPVDLGKALCGFRHDEDESPFRALRPRADSSWHRDLKLAVHPKSQLPPPRSSWSESLNRLKPVAVIVILFLFLVAISPLFE